MHVPSSTFPSTELFKWLAVKATSCAISTISPRETVSCEHYLQFLHLTLLYPPEQALENIKSLF